MECRRCGYRCDGTMMRTDRRFHRVRKMILEQSPKDEAGRIALCHQCQRSVYFAGGMLHLLVRDLERMAKATAVRKQERA
jgi:hypothetical protein